jgi:hypothetical protein
MKRRSFITLLGGAAAWPLAALPQQPAMPVIGYLGIASREEAPARFAGLLRGLKEVNFVEGQNVTIEYRPTGDQYDRFSEFAADLVRHRVDVIFASDNVGSLAAKAATANRLRYRWRPGRIGLGHELQSAGWQRHRNIELDSGACREASRTSARTHSLCSPIGNHDQRRRPWRRAGDGRRLALSVARRRKG